MKRDKKFEHILNDCLERTMVKGDAIERCLARYPEEADRLGPLLKLAIAARKAAAIKPPAEFKARARHQFRSAMAEAATRKNRAAPIWIPRWAMVTAMVVGLLLAGSGTVAAAGYTMPDHPLYSVKLAAERAQLVFTFSDLGKAKLYAELSDKRVAEIIYIASRGNGRRTEAAVERLDKELAQLVSLAPVLKDEPQIQAMAPAPAATPTPGQPEDRGAERAPGKAKNKDELKQTLSENASNHQVALNAALEKAPESAKPALRRAIKVSSNRYKKALDALDE